ncbi:MAG TPA: hypothetical protein VGE27_08155 [Gemmatimonas sp.]|uniref:hypothetical protein n=1 Tax=Gemmatimonas sp. TaxID=1962908 RepID=UPI002ED7D9DC
MTSHSRGTARYIGTRRSLRFLAVALPISAIISCQSLEVTNPNTPGVEVVYGSGENVEAALVGAWRAFWGVAQGARSASVYPVKQLSNFGNELASADVDVLISGPEPRVAIDNRDQGGSLQVKPWYDLNEAIGVARAAHQAIAIDGVQVGAVTSDAPQGVDSPRARIFAKFTLGIANVHLGLLYDQAYTADETTDITQFQYELRPYGEVSANGIRILREAIAEAAAAPPFTLPATWINGQSLSRDALIRIMHSYIVRARVYTPRTPTERAQLPWGAILAQLDSGITANFAQQADLLIPQTASAYYQMSFQATAARVNNRMVGPADTSGAYQRWLANPLGTRNQFTVVTPDRRIHGNTPTSAGRYYTYLATQTMSALRGTYMHSRYRNTRYLVAPSNNFHATGLIVTMSVDEMKFIRAEALYRLGRFSEAAALINTSRLASNLAAVTASGPPSGAACVPRRDDGTCGDLFDAIQYEKRIELYPTEAIIAYADARGWGKLLPGTPLHLPVPGRELETMGFAYYTFGGGGVGSAP